MNERKRKLTIRHGCSAVISGLTAHSALVDGLVVVGWLERGTTGLHCTHHVLTYSLKDLSLFLLRICCCA